MTSMSGIECLQLIGGIDSTLAHTHLTFTKRRYGDGMRAVLTRAAST